MLSAKSRRVKGTFSMPSPEVRLTTLEYNLDQFKAEATSYYQEMALQVTMSKGLTEDAVKRLMQLRVQVDKRFNSTDQQFVEVKQDLAEVKQDLTGVKQELTGVKQDLAGVKQDIGDHTTRLDRIETLLAQILARLPEKP
jgi:chromosome segregation ATPase